MQRINFWHGLSSSNQQFWGHCDLPSMFLFQGPIYKGKLLHVVENVDILGLVLREAR